MKIQPQTDEAMKRLAACIETHRAAMLTVRDAAGQLSSRPMTPLEMDAAGALWMLSSRRTVAPLFESAAEQPANLSFVEAGDADYVSVSGQVALVDDMQRKQALWALACRPWFSGPADPELVLLRVQPRLADVWDGPDSDAAHLLAMSASGARDAAWAPASA